MWNATDTPSVIYYGANFVDYIGHLDRLVAVVKPTNGLYYDSFIYNNYFGLYVDGAAAADPTTLEAIAAIEALPETVTLADKPLVEAARAAYEKISSDTQRGLVNNLSKLLAAEQRISDLEYINGPSEPDTTPDVDGDQNEGSKLDAKLVIIIALGVALAAALAAAVVFFLAYSKQKKAALKTDELPVKINENTSESPEESVEAPEESVEAPEESVEAPEESVEAPEESVEAPEESAGDEKKEEDSETE